ncbi:DUF3987 domain-containing protein [Planctomycetales bacterium ZRK34]|nr:DUF3987 domain-containing protein [Planctomycetales bacterium ZRK34]
MSVEADNLQSVAERYLAAGLCVLPARRAEKRPAVGRWRQYQKRQPTQAELSAWLANGPNALCVLCGTTPKRIEMIDFDAGGELFEAWRERVDPELFARLFVERTPSGGYHAAYGNEEAICGNLKLAQRRSEDEASGGKIETLIETRGEGGLFLCTPTPGYELVQGDLTDLPVLTGAERDQLLQAAWDLNEYLPPVVDGPRQASGAGGCTGPTRGHVSLPVGGGTADRPGDDFNARGDVGELLAEHGWVRIKAAAPGADGNEYWRRPGKNAGTSATLKEVSGGRVFYVFSSNAAPFEPNRGYSPFAVYALLNHGGYFEQAASSLRQLGFGSNSLADNADGPDISAIMRMSVAPGACPSDNAALGQTMAMSDGQAAPSPQIADPGPMPAEMLRMPGFVSEVMDHCLATAPYPNQVMAFAGALSLLAFLAGRKVRDNGDNRTNIYLLGLAHSAAGKDWPRKINTRVLHQIGLAEALGERFASGEGIQDALFQKPTMLFQTDEIDGMLQSINKAKDARHEAIMSTLLTMYSSSNSVYPMRRKAGKESPGVIDQPCLVIFGTAIPNHYYEALSERMLTNGFFARMIILEAGPRAPGQEPSIRALPDRVVETATWWSKFHPGEHRDNLIEVHPVPAIVDHTDDARRLLIESREEAEAEYAKAESRSDSVGTTVWGRVSEQTRKLALLYAISENHENPTISLPGVRWASQFVMHQTRRMLFMAASHVADNPFHAECLKLLEKLRDAPGMELPHSVLLKRMKMDAKTFTVLVETLIQQGDVEIVTGSTAGRPTRAYRLVGEVKQAGETSPGGERCLA